MSIGSSQSWRRRSRGTADLTANQATNDVPLSLEHSPRRQSRSGTGSRLENLRSAVFAERRIEQPAALAELEQGRLKPANIFAREIAAGNGRFGRTMRLVERGHGFCPPRSPIGPRFARTRLAGVFEGRLDAVRIGGIGSVRLLGGTENRRPKAQQSAAGLLCAGTGSGRLFAAIFVRGGPRRLRRPGAPNRLNELDALVLEDALHAADRVALAVEQMANSAQQVHVVGPILAAAGAAPHRRVFVATGAPRRAHQLGEDA